MKPNPRITYFWDLLVFAGLVKGTGKRPGPDQTQTEKDC